MSVTKRKDSPHYWYDFTIGGQRFRGSCETNDKQTAKSIAAKLRTEALHNKHLGRKPRITLDVAFAKYWKEHGQETRTGLSHTLHTFRDFLKFWGKDFYLDEINDAEINRCVADLQGRIIKKDKRLAPASINRRLDMLRAVILRARRWGVTVPEVNISAHRLQMPEARTRWLTPEEAERLIEHAADHLKPIIQFALYTGARLSNITQLQWQQVDLKERIIRLRVKSKLPGGKLLEVPISQPCYDLLQAQGVEKTGHVFTRSFKAGRTLPLASIKRSFKSACKAAKITDFRFHDLRHTAASWMVQQGVPLDVVRDVLGHSDISMTQKYAHRNAADRTAALTALANRRKEAV
ncbi:MAG: tyrosine-type recombinase/integrase [Alphaproteobacteria bacterium]|jgi:integrase